MTEQLGGRNAAYHGYSVYGIDGTLDVPALESALQMLVDRHVLLRSRIVEEGGVPYLVADGAPDVDVVRLDVRDASANRATILRRLQESEIDRPFELGHERPLRVALARVSDDEEVLLVVLHHMFTDAWSMQIFLRELAALYTGQVEGRRPQLPPLPAQYADFARWQRAWLQTGEADAQLSYWAERLRDLEPFELLTDRPRPAMPTFLGASRRFIFDESLLRGLKRLSQEQHVTLFMTVLAAFQLVVGRWTGRHDVAVGIPVANRTRQEFESVIGFFVNMLVLRTHLGGNPRLGDLLRRVREDTIAAFARQDVPFERVVERVRPTREHGRNPLFRVAFALQNASANLHRVRLPQVDLARHELRPRFTRFDVECYVAEASGGLQGWILYSDELFDASTIDGLIDDYRSTLEAFVAGRTRHAASAPRAARAVPTIGDGAFEPVHLRIERQCREQPLHTAIIAGDDQVTYGDLDALANGLARRLVTAGVRPGGLVGIAMDRSVPLVVAVLATLKCGAAYVPLDPQYPAARLAQMVRTAAPQLVLAQPGFDSGALEFDGELLTLGREALSPAAPLADRPTVDADSLAYVIFTSGSTGRPKGVMIPHGALANHMQWLQRAYPLDASDAVLFRTAFSFDASVLELFWPLMTGGTLVVAASDRHRDGRYLADVMSTHLVTVAQFVPSLLELVLDEFDAPSLSSLRHLFCGGERLTSALLDRVAERSAAALHNLYGPTETCIDATCWDCVPPFSGHTLPIGEPISNTAVYVLDASGDPVPPRALGEMHIGGAGLARGYCGEPALTAERFLPDPFSGEPGARMYRTGDLGRARPDGALEFERRADDQVKLFGHRIELEEIESVARANPDTGGAAAVVTEIAPGAPGLVCFLVRRPNAGRRRRPERITEYTQELIDWQRIHDGIFEGPSDDWDTDLNFAGWRSSYTGKLYEADEMREWRESFVSRVLAYAPRRVLEIGCGSGMILQRCAPACEEYWATDFSERALRVTADASRHLPHVRLLDRRADDFSGIPSGYFDLVVMNSVVQYFPGAPYFDAVLSDACRALRPGGVVLLGDIRLLPLLVAFRADVAARAESANDTVGAVRARTARAMASERELVLHPAAFVDFARRHPELASRVEVYFKRGVAATEMNAYRADVVLRSTPATLDPTVQIVDGITADLVSVRAQLALHQGVVRVEGVVNPRVATGWFVNDALAALPRDATFHRVIEDATTWRDTACATWIDPEDWFRLAMDTGRVAELVWPRNGDPRCYDVVFAPDRAVAASAAQLVLDDAVVQQAELSTDPLGVRRSKVYASVVEALFAAQLPPQAQPTRVHVVPAFPRTANGKIDRRELARWAAELEQGDAAAASDPAATDLEQLVLQIWRDVLKTEVGVDGSFFDAGGHSLLAVQALGRLNVQLNVTIPLSAVFVHPSARQLAAWLATQPVAAAAAS